MPTPGWLTQADLPQDAQLRRYIAPTNLDQILDQFASWRGNVNGGGHKLSNVLLVSQALELGADIPGDHISLIDLIGDNTYSDYGLRMIRNAGADGGGGLYNRGLGPLSFVNNEAAPILFYTSNAERMRISSAGYIGINTAGAPSGRLHVNHGSADPDPSLLLNQPLGSWVTADYFNNYRFIQTSSAAGDGFWKAFHVGPGGVAIGYGNTPTYGSPDALYCGGRVGIGTTSPQGLLQINGANAGGVDAISGIILERGYGEVGDSMDIVWSVPGGDRVARFAGAAVAGGVGGFVFYCQNGGDGYNNEIMRMDGRGRISILCNNPHDHRLFIGGPNRSSIAAATQFAIGEESNNSQYRLTMGFANIPAWTGIIQAIAGGVTAPLLLNPNGGRVGVGTSSVGSALQVNSDAAPPIAPPGLGNHGGICEMSSSGGGGGGYGLQFGALNVGDCWLQVGRFDGSATAYNLLLQPNGGGIKMWLGGSLKTLSVDGSGFVKAT